MKKLYGYYGGSRAFGLPLTETSDWDYYSVGTSRHIVPYKIYPNVKIHQKKRTATVDVEKVELCSYFTYLMNGFAFQVESLWAHKSFMDYLDPVFEAEVLQKRNLFIDRNQLIENVSCNIEIFRKKKVEDIAKLRIEVFSRTQDQKVRDGVDRMLQCYKEYGFYYKDYLHGIRLVSALLTFLKTDVYPIKVTDGDSVVAGVLSNLKQFPGTFSKGFLDQIIDDKLAKIREIDMDDDEDKFRFDASHALNTLNKFYA